MPGITFAPTVNLADAGRLGPAAGKLQNFMKTRVGDAGILGTNKVDLAGSEKLPEICLLMRGLNNP